LKIFRSSSKLEPFSAIALASSCPILLIKSNHKYGACPERQGCREMGRLPCKFRHNVVSLDFHALPLHSRA